MLLMVTNPGREKSIWTPSGEFEGQVGCGKSGLDQKGMCKQRTLGSGERSHVGMKRRTKLLFFRLEILRHFSPSFKAGRTMFLGLFRTLREALENRPRRGIGTMCRRERVFKFESSIEKLGGRPRATVCDFGRPVSCITPNRIAQIQNL